MMYETFLGMDRHPFSATPDPSCFVAAEGVQAAFDELMVCVERGQGIGVLTGTAGIGKTLLCQKLVSELSESFETVFLNNANYAMPRSLLQAILYELGQPYSRMDEQELRLELMTVVKSVRPKKQGMVLVIDEAHLLSEKLLEEIRAITNLAEDGEPLVHLVLSGQMSLEEKLIDQNLDALNQRIRAQVCLEPLTRQESTQYVSHRLSWAGSNISQIFSPEAVEIICQASDGTPRCLNQLCDHSLLLAYATEQKPVQATTVRAALDDLRQLPLHWNELSTSTDSPSGHADSFDGDLEKSALAIETSSEGRSGDSDGDYDISSDAHASGQNAQQPAASIEFGAADELFSSETGESSVTPSTEVEFEPTLCDEVDVSPDCKITNQATEQEFADIASDGIDSVKNLEAMVVNLDSDQTNSVRTDDELVSSFETTLPVVEEIVSVAEPVVPSVLEDAEIQSDQITDSKPSGFHKVEFESPVASVNQFVQFSSDIEGANIGSDVSTFGPETVRFEEEIVDDPYATLDAGIEKQNVSGTVWNIPAHAQPSIEPINETIELSNPVTSREIDCGHESETSMPRPDHIIDGMMPLLDEAIDGWFYTRPLSYEPGADVNTVDDTNHKHSMSIDTLLTALESQSLTDDSEIINEQISSGASESMPSTVDLDMQSELAVESFGSGDEIGAQISSNVLDTCPDTQISLVDRLNQIKSERIAAEPPAMIDKVAAGTPEQTDHEADYSDGEQFDIVQPESDASPIIPCHDQSNEVPTADCSDEPSPIHSSNSEFRSPHTRHRSYGRLFSELRRRQEHSSRLSE